MSRLRRQSALPAGAALALLLVAPAAAGEAPLERTARADGIALRVAIDRTRLWIDERIELRLRVEARHDLALELPEPELGTGGLALVEPVRTERQPQPGDRQLLEQRILLEPTATGTLPLPPLAVSYRLAGAAAPLRLAVEPLAVEVRSVLPAGEALPPPREVAPPVPLPDPPGGPAPWLALALLVPLLAAAALRLRRRRPELAASAAAPSPEAVALAELAGLEAAPATEDPGAERHVRLASILRDYARRRLGLDAPRLTTEELAAGLARLGPRLSAPAARLTGLLAGCDRVKFARHRPGPAELRADLAAARTLIRDTAAAVAAGGEAAQPAGRAPEQGAPELRTSL